MDCKIGDYVTRVSHNHDLVFKIVDLVDGVAYLKGVNVRLYADSEINDLSITDNIESLEEEDRNLINRVNSDFNLNRSDYFYLPGSILHIDGDQDYLNKCLNFYKEAKLRAYGVKLLENEISGKIGELLTDMKPDIVVITGHDAYYHNLGNEKMSNNYKNSINFINAVKEARKIEKSQDKLIIIAGACQSNYEELIRSGANFASSPKRINIHALDPAIIASSLALSNKNKEIDLIKMIDKTKYGSEGIGGIITLGTMYVGYPR